MSYRTGGYRGASPWVGVGVALLMLGWCSSSLLLTRFREVTPDAVAAELVADRQSGEMFRTMRRAFPEEFGEITTVAATALTSGASREREQDLILDRLIADGQRHRADLVRTPTDALARMRRAEIAVVEQLRLVDMGLCAQYASKGSVRLQAPIPGLDAAMIAYRNVSWAAYAAAREAPVARPAVRPAPRDWRAVAEAMRGLGLAEPVIAVFFSPAGLAGAGASEQCEGGLAFLQAIDAQPADRADRLYGFLSARAQ